MRMLSMTGYLLTAASRGGHSEVVKILLQAHADINAFEGGGNTALFWAVFSDHIDVVKLLLQHGADASKKTAMDDYQ